MLIILYAFIILFWYLYGNKSDRNRTKYITITAVVILMIMGLRNMAIYDDTFFYILGFKRLEDMSVSSIYIRWPKDTFFYIASYYIHPLISHNYTIWLTLISAIFIYPISVIIRKYSPNPMLSWICFIFLGLFLFTMAGLRQTVAIGLVLYGFISLMEGKWIRFLISLTIAYLFHGTSFIFAIVYPIIRYKITFNYKILLIYFIGTVIFIIAGQSVLGSVIDIISETDERYSGYAEEMSGSTFTYFFQQLLLVAPSLYYLKNRLRETNVAIFANISMLGLMLVSLSPTIAEMFRLSMYFSWANLILFPMAMFEAKKTGSNIQLILMSFFFVYLIFINKTLTNPYFFWFEDPTEYIRNNFMLN